jgi:hypothetical protein
MDNLIEPRPAGRLERMQIVYRNEIKIVVCRGIFAAQTSRPRSERE